MSKILKIIYSKNSEIMIKFTLSDLAGEEFDKTLQYILLLRQYGKSYFGSQFNHSRPTI